MTNASYGGIEDLFKRSQEQAILGTSGQQEDPFRETMTDPAVIRPWATAFADGVGAYLGSLFSGGTVGQAFTRGMLAANARSG